MIRIRSSFGEVELEGSHRDMSELSRRVVEFADSSSEELLVSTEAEIDPAPYGAVLKSLLFVKEPGKISATPVRSQLILRGSADFFKLLAANLPVLDGDPPESGFHVHFDSVSWPNEVSDQSVSMVFSLRSADG